MLINKFTMKHFVTIPPYEISPNREEVLTNNSFFGHLKTKNDFVIKKVLDVKKN